MPEFKCQTAPTDRMNVSVKKDGVYFTIMEQQEDGHYEVGQFHLDPKDAIELAKQLTNQPTN